MSTGGYDPTIYLGAAEHYVNGRPPYSAGLVAVLEREVGIGRVLDVGCGPGVVALEVAPVADEVVGLDPDADMLAVASRRGRERGLGNVRWVQGLAEDLPTLGLGPFRLVTFGQSFQWTDRERVAEAVYDLLEPGGSLVALAHRVAGRPRPDGTGDPPIPHDEVDRLVERYLGSRRRAGQGFRSPPPDRYEDALARTRFGSVRIVFAPGRPDVVRDVDGVVAGYLSMSFAAPHLFGDRLAEFEAEVRDLLHRRSATGRFWDWPGDTELVIATKSA